MGSGMKLSKEEGQGHNVLVAANISEKIVDRSPQLKCQDAAEVIIKLLS